jgi:hypothetical protein
VGNFFFNPSSLNVNVGDTIRWVWVAGSHTTTSTPGAIPAGAASWDALITSAFTSFEYKVTVAGSYAYVCTPHVPGMVATFTATAVAPTLSVSPSNRNVAASSGSTTFTVTSNSGWTSVSNAAWCTVTSSGTGNGTINASYEANAGTSPRTATVTVSVQGLPDQTVTVTQAASTVGISEQASDDFRVFPNPTRGIFKVNSPSNSKENLQITVMDISGKQIQSRTCSGSEEYSFDLTGGNAGYYFVRIQSGNTTTVRRIMLID